MISLQRKKKRSLVSKQRFYWQIACCAAALCLLVALVCVSVAKHRLEAALDEKRNELAMSIHSELKIASRSFDQVQFAGTDVPGKVLPTIRQALYTANKFNTLLTLCYGQDQSVVDPIWAQDLQACLNEYDRLAGLGQNPSAALERMAASMNQLETALTARFGADDAFMPLTASR